MKLGNRWGFWVTDFLISPKVQWRWQNIQQNTCKPIIRIHQQDHHCHPIVFISDIQKDIDFMKTLKPTNIIHHITKLKDKKKSMILFGAVHIFVGLNPSFQSMDRLSGTVTEGSWVFLSQQSAAASHLAVGPQLWQFLLVYINMNYEYVRSTFIRILDTTQCVLFISIMQMFVIIINTDIFCCEVEFLDGVGRPSVFVLLLLINE